MGRGDRGRAAARLPHLAVLLAGCVGEPATPRVSPPAIAVFVRDGVLRWTTTDRARFGDVSPALTSPVESGPLADGGAWMTARLDGQPVLALLHRDRAGVAASVFHAPAWLHVTADGAQAVGPCEADPEASCVYDVTASGLTSSGRMVKMSNVARDELVARTASAAICHTPCGAVASPDRRWKLARVEPRALVVADEHGASETIADGADVEPIAWLP